MSRIPYQPIDLAEPRDIVDPIRKRRGGSLLELDRVLLHAPPFARGWNAHLGAVRTELELPARLRELVIIGVGALNGAHYEVKQHAPFFKAGGGTEAQFEALADYETAARNEILFDARERALMQLTIEMTRRVKVPDSVFEEVRRHFPDSRSLMEIVGIIASYNMVARVIVAMEIYDEHA